MFKEKHLAVTTLAILSFTVPIAANAKEVTEKQGKSAADKPHKEVATKEKVTKDAAPKDKPQKETKHVELFPKDTRTVAQKDFARNEAAVRAESDRRQKEKTAEAMRDKTHDLRLKTGKDTSVGGSLNPPSVDIKKTFP